MTYFSVFIGQNEWVLFFQMKEYTYPTVELNYRKRSLIYPGFV